MVLATLCSSFVTALGKRLGVRPFVILIEESPLQIYPGEKLFLVLIDDQYVFMKQPKRLLKV